VAQRRGGSRGDFRKVRLEKGGLTAVQKEDDYSTGVGFVEVTEELIQNGGRCTYRMERSCPVKALSRWRREWGRYGPGGRSLLDGGRKKKSLAVPLAIRGGATIGSEDSLRDGKAEI